MAYIVIEPVQVELRGGSVAEITAFDPLANTDQFHGQIQSQSSTVPRSWDLNGTCRDGTQEINIKTSCPEFLDLKNMVFSYRD
ncbi:hypothetical protein [Thalassovita sp.]|uniref:hypothetical protein n=1 Tax=Thalassovita sp. TaxID=1979401 RepID=UPI002AB0F9B4|nr:hypothetical protein [Thalassovita sp.]